MIKIGIDEVGVGSLFGPLVVVATANLKGWHLDGIRDSKTIKSERVRQSLASEIQHSMIWSSATAHADAIDRFGMDAMLKSANRRLIKELASKIRVIYPTAEIEVVIDGAGPTWIEEGCRVVSIPKADATVFEVSAASVLAKVICDNWITDQVKNDPDLEKYGLLTNRGYGTEAHADALAKHGQTKHHRANFCRTILKTRLQRNQSV